MTFVRLAPDAGISPRRPQPRKAALLLAALVALLAASLPQAALAGPPAPLQVATPFSWVQFKQQFGVLDTNNNNTLSLPGTPTVVYASGQDGQFGGIPGSALQYGDQIEGWLLGDGGASETPLPRNYMRDTNALLTGGSEGVENWLAPFYNLSLSGQQNANITIDNENTNNSFGQTQNANLTYTLFYGTYVDGTINGAPSSPLFNPFNGTPPTGASNNANGWETATGDPVYELDYYLSDYRRTQNTSATVSNGIVVRADPSKGLLYNGATALATWAFGIPNTNPPGIVQPTTNPSSNFDATNSTTPPVDSSSAALPVTNTTTATGLIRTAPVTQSYDAYAWFPSEDASSFSNNVELHIDDAEYTVAITNPYTNAVIYSFTSYVDQTGGGGWTKIAGPFAVPIVINPLNANQSGPAIVTVTLDNTTDDTVNGVSVTQLPNYHVVADAVQLRPDNGFMFGSPLAVNVSDYPELAGGYPDAAINPATGVDLGGMPITYRAAQETLTAATATGVATDSGGNYFTPGAVPNGEYTEDIWGNQWANGAADPFPYAGNPPATVALSGTTRPIDQVVYITRSENLGVFQNGIEQTVGAVYAIDGLTGNVIWRYPNTLPFTLDDAQGAPIFTTAGASTNRNNTAGYNFTNWFTGSPTSAPALLGTDFFDTTYTIINAENRNDGSRATATWALPASVGVNAQNFNVYVWFPSQTAGENHISDAEYSVAGTACNFVNQQAGGKWVQLTQQGTGNPVFSLAAGSQITLDNTTSPANTTMTAGEPVGYYVVADAVMVVPANAPGPITSTPVIVRNMRVLVDPATQTYSARTCIVFTDNTPSGGRVFCVDAAGDGNGDDTVVDQNGEPVSYDQNGNLLAPPQGGPSGAAVPANFAYAGPLKPLQYGTTKLYWCWQPNSAAVILQNRGNETQETAADPNRDLPLPGAYELNSPTVQLVQTGLTFNFGTKAGYANPAGADPIFSSVIYVGNSNGYLYAIDGQGTLNNTNDPNLFDQSVDTTTPTADVYWWFGTGGGIAYAPAVDPKNGAIYVTSYDPDGTNKGRLYALHTGTFTFEPNPFINDIQNNIPDLVFSYNGGPIGNFGKGDPKAAQPTYLTGSLNYNLNQIPYWSFPDGYGTVDGANGQPLADADHHITSTVAGFDGALAPALPLGDMAGAPSVYTNANDSLTRIYVTANEPTPDGVGPSFNGRIYSVYASGGTGPGTMAWAYPDINGNPNAVGTLGQQATTFDYNPSGTATPNLPNKPLGAFTQFDPYSGFFVSSSPVEGLVTFPANLIPVQNQPNLTTAQEDNQQQMLYTGCTDGTLYALNLGTNDDANTTADLDTTRLIYNEPIGDGPIYSTPALISGSAVNKNTGAPDVGGVVFLTTSVGDIWEVESTPFTDPTGNNPTAPIIIRDWAWAGPGGLSSPGLAGFDTHGFTTPQASIVNPNNARDDSEWIYCGSDTGFLYGFTPNTSTGGDFFPGNYIPTQNVGPNNDLDLSRTMISAISLTNPATTGTVSWGGLVTPPNNPAFDWGQSFYIVIGGIDSPTTNNGTAAFPIGQSISVTMTAPGASGRTITIGPYPMTNVGAANPKVQIVPIKNDGTFPPALPANAVNNFGKDPNNVYWAAVIEYGPIEPLSAATTAAGQPIGGQSTSNDPATPGSIIPITNIQETAIVNGAYRTFESGARTANIVNTGTAGSGTSTYGYVAPIDQASIGILNPIAVAGGGRTFDGGFQPIAESPTSLPAPQTLGPFNGVDGTNQANFTGVNGYQMADANGNDIPISPPVGGTITTSTGGTVNPTQPLGDQATGVSLAAVVVAADPGLIGHGTSGDTGTGNNTDPVAGAAGASALNAPGLAAGNITPYGSSMLVVADRSALGTLGGAGAGLSTSLHDMKMSNPQIGWTDNSAVNNANSVINMLPWDQQPTSIDTNPTNPSLDYPNIPRGNIHVQVEARHDSAGGDESGTPTDITQSAGVLANCPPTQNQTGRIVRPNPLLMQVDIPKFQPANLESDNDTTWQIGGELSHVQNVGAAAGNYLPQGYKSEALRIFDDIHGTGVFESDDPVRYVNVWVGVPVDMSMQIAQSTTDIGAVPDGFGLWNPTNPGGNETWNPYFVNAGGAAPQYKPWYVPVQVYNTGNVNLLNVHFDQQTGSYSTAGIAPGAPLNMGSDTVTDQLGNQSPLWPFFDSYGGVYTGTTTNPYLVRSNLDEDVYTGNTGGVNANTFNPAEDNGSIVVPGPTAHKARPGEAPPGEPITIPDEPHDASNPDTVPLASFTLPAVYGNSPTVSIAVPLGTPVGTYSQVLRTFEGSDVPYDSWTGPTYGLGTAAYSPSYFYNPGVWANSGNVQDAFVFDSTTGTPLQFYSDPGTVLVAHVVEGRATDDSPIMANTAAAGGAADVEQGALAMIDPPRLLLNGSANPNATPADSNDIQPWAFADTTTAPNPLDPEPGLGLLWPSARNFAGQSTPSYDILAESLTGGGAGHALNTPTSPVSWWSGTGAAGVPDNLTQNATARIDWPSATTALNFTSYSPYVVAADNLAPIGGPNGNTALRVDSLAGVINTGGTPTTSQLAGAPSYAIRYIGFTGSTEPPSNTTTAWNVLEPTSTIPIFGPRGCYVNTPTNPALPTAITGQPLIIFWSETSGGRSQIYYQSPHGANGTDGYPLILSGTPSSATTPTPAALTIPAGVSSVSNPTPVTRPFLYPWPDAEGNIRYWPVVDVTYSGVSTLNGETDLYTSRYIVWKKDPTNNTNPADPPILLLVPFDVQPPAAATPNVVSEVPETQSLVANSTGTVWEAQDVGWVRDPGTFTLYYIPYSATGAVPNPIPLIGAGGQQVLPVYDKSSGNWVFSGINVPDWLNNETQTATNVTVYVNPDQGTVRFSTPPSPVQVTLGTGTTTVYPSFAAAFVPQAMRATMHSGTNTMPVAFVDEALKANTLQMPAGGVSGSPQPVPVVASRYWYVWRKSGTGATGAASTASTLYFKTRRLTVVLANPVQYEGNAANGTLVVPPVASININGVPVDIPVDIDPGHYITQNSTTGQPPQMVPGRIYFPDFVQLTPGGQMYSTEGATVTIQYTAEPYTFNGAAAGGGQTTQTSTIQWLDEPYTNSPTDTAFRAGEREIPISNIINESQPCAFLDPVAYSDSTSNNAAYPHRVWLFWVSTRNANGQNSGVGAGTGADVYWEALDPRFSTTSPP